MAKGGTRVGAGRKRKAPAAGAVRVKPAATPAPADPSIGGMLAPDYLSEEAAKHFGRIARILLDQGRANAHHTPIVAELARVQELIDQLQQTVAKDGASYTTTNAHGGTMVRARPEMAMLSQAQKQAHALLSDLMLTPTSAMRLGVPKKRDNAFADL